MSTIYSDLLSKVHFESGFWKVSPNIQLKTIFIILLFSKKVFASANIICNQSLCPNQYFQCIVIIFNQVVTSSILKLTWPYFIIKPFFLHDQNATTKVELSWERKKEKMKWKAFFMIFKGLPLNQEPNKTMFFRRGESDLKFLSCHRFKMFWILIEWFKNFFSCSIFFFFL